MQKLEKFLAPPWAQNREYPQLFTDSLWRKLDKEFQLTDCPDPQRVREQLEFAGGIYFHHRATNELRQTTKEIRGELKQIEKAAQKLYERVNQYDRATQALWQVDWGLAEQEFGNFAIDQLKDKEGPEMVEYVGRFGDKGILVRSHEHGGIYQIRQDKDWLISGLGTIAKYARSASEGLLPKRKGKRRDMALRMWTTNIATLWTNLLGREFTHDAEKGEPVAQATRFSVTALRRIDPKVTNSQVFTAMRTYIRETPASDRK